MRARRWLARRRAVAPLARRRSQPRRAGRRRRHARRLRLVPHRGHARSTTRSTSSPTRPASTSSCSSPATPARWCQGGAHRRQPGGRRDVGRRQHVLSRASTTACSSPTRRRPRRRRRRAARRSCRDARRHRSTSATCASTTTSPGSPSTASSRRPTSTTLADPEYADLLVVENPATSSPGLAFLLATVAEFGDDGWVRLLGSASSPTAWRSSTAGPRPTTSASAAPATGDRPLVVSYGSEPAGRGALRRPAGRRGADRRRRRHVLPPGRVRRRAARHRRPRRGPPPGRLPRRRGVPARGRRSTCSCTRRNADVELPAGVHRVRRRPRRPAHARPGDDRRATASDWIDDAGRRSCCGDAPRSRRSRAAALVRAGAGRRAGGRPASCSTSGRSPRCSPAASSRAPIADTLRRRGTWDVVWFTLWQAVVSTALTIVVGLSPAYVHRPLPTSPAGGSSTARCVAVFVLPTVVSAPPCSPLLPDSLERSVWAIVVAHVVFNLAVVVRTVGAMLATLPRDLEAAAATLGASPWRVFRDDHPAADPAGDRAPRRRSCSCSRSRRSAWSASSAAPRNTTIEVEIWRQATQLGDIGAAATLTVLQLVARRRARRRGRRGRSAGAADRSGSTVAHAAPRAAARPPTLARRRHGRRAPRSSSLVPLVALVERSLRTGDGYSLAAWRNLGGGRGAARHQPRRRPGRRAADVVALRPSVAVVVAVVVGTLAALAIAAARRRGRLLDTALMLPLATSAVTIGFGMLITFDTRPVDWRGDVVARAGRPGARRHPVRRAHRAAGAARRRADDRLEAAATLGASPLRAWCDDRRCRTCAGRSSSAPGSPRRSRSASSARRASCRAAGRRRCRSRSSGCSAAPATCSRRRATRSP